MVAAVTNPDTVRAMLEDYRAGLGVDREHEDGRPGAGRTVSCPTLMLWSSTTTWRTCYGDPLAVWRPWCTDVGGAPIDSGHHMAEDNPEALAAPSSSS